MQSAQTIVFEEKQAEPSINKNQGGLITGFQPGKAVSQDATALVGDMKGLTDKKLDPQACAHRVLNTNEALLSAAGLGGARIVYPKQQQSSQNNKDALDAAMRPMIQVGSGLAAKYLDPQKALLKLHDTCLRVVNNQLNADDIALGKNNGSPNAKTDAHHTRFVFPKAVDWSTYAPNSKQAKSVPFCAKDLSKLKTGWGQLDQDLKAYCKQNPKARVIMIGEKHGSVATHELVATLAAKGMVDKVWLERSGKSNDLASVDNVFKQTDTRVKKFFSFGDKTVSQLNEKQRLRTQQQGFEDSYLSAFDAAYKKGSEEKLPSAILNGAGHVLKSPTANLETDLLMGKAIPEYTMTAAMLEQYGGMALIPLPGELLKGSISKTQIATSLHKMPSKVTEQDILKMYGGGRSDILSSMDYQPFRPQPYGNNKIMKRRPLDPGRTDRGGTLHRIRAEGRLLTSKIVGLQLPNGEVMKLWQIEVKPPEKPGWEKPIKQRVSSAQNTIQHSQK
ncbi:hypothetical protein E1178_16160 [Roseibium hamelinense]|uniref:hypothetical protein n=1 Tax=Roseibium hamelinense TaxID=150831 RepID=UPI00119F880C|nr:hypothetical protein [Roseibium hamelinense]MTI45141.1 hypothetical protein [Roseibium hamelinense]